MSLRLSSLVTGIKHPVAALAYIRGPQALERWYQRFELGQFERPFRLFEGVPKNWVRLNRNVTSIQALKKEINTRARKYALNLEDLWFYAPYHWFYYLLVRWMKPERIIETGVWYGLSSAFLLQGLHDNGCGGLYSIDLPNVSYVNETGHVFRDYVGDESNTGCLVPESLRSRWYLTLGSTQSKLPPLLDSLKEVDLFIRDSEHTYATMMFEFRSVWPHLKKAGVLVSDDAHQNNAFRDFARSVPCKSVQIERRLNEKMGILLKEE